MPDAPPESSLTLHSPSPQNTYFSRKMSILEHSLHRQPGRPGQRSGTCVSPLCSACSPQPKAPRQQLRDRARPAQPPPATGNALLPPPGQARSRHVSRLLTTAPTPLTSAVAALLCGSPGEVQLQALSPFRISTELTPSFFSKERFLRPISLSGHL